jgi:ketosteroid isomerase-like protein
MTTDDTPRHAPAEPIDALPGEIPNHAAVWAAITGMYQAYSTGDRERIDAFLDPDATIWDSATPRLLRGKAELDRVRDARPVPDPADGQSALTAYDQVIDVFGSLAIARYWLRVDLPGPHPATPRPPELVRNTAILYHDDDRWLIIHLHEDVQSGAQAAT